jgi:hypothetical protein
MKKTLCTIYGFETEISTLSPDILVGKCPGIVPAEKPKS